MKYEYRIISDEQSDYETEIELNKLGLEGWELVGVRSEISGGYMIPNRTSTIYILKRVLK